MWSKLEQVFNRIGLPYSRQGSYDEDATWPLSFFTFYNPNSNNQAFYDNKAHSSVWYWDVYYYTKDYGSLYTKMDELIDMAEEEGFTANGKGNDIDSERKDYAGRTVTLIYIEHH